MRLLQNNERTARSVGTSAMPCRFCARRARTTEEKKSLSRGSRRRFSFDAYFVRSRPNCTLLLSFRVLVLMAYAAQAGRCLFGYLSSGEAGDGRNEEESEGEKREVPSLAKEESLDTDLMGMFLLV
eukprot:766081-Hanusia_phi.AAC.6